jgi:hypothetical protein
LFEEKSYTVSFCQYLLIIKTMKEPNVRRQNRLFRAVLKSNLVVASMLAAGSLLAVEYHVSPNGVDLNEGSKRKPFKTISAAAAKAQPGDVIMVHEGVYRERINPPRGGTSDEKRIVYQAATGEKVTIKGSEIIKGWKLLDGDVWAVSLPNRCFGDFNPYSDLIHGDWYEARQPYHTGAVYLNGHWLKEAPRKSAVTGVEDEGPGGEELMTCEFLRVQGISTVDAVDASAMSGEIDVVEKGGKRSLSPLKDGDWLAFDGVDFGEEATGKFQLSTGSPIGGGIVEIRKDSATGELLGKVNAGLTAEWHHFQVFSCNLSRPLSGRHKIVLVFKARPLAPPSTDDLGYWYAEVDDQVTTIWAQFQGIDPNEELVEINVRQSVFYPEEPFRNYITVRGFTLEQAATPWSPPTAEQIGLIGVNWSKGWVIENNTIRYSACTGLTLGKHGDEFDNARNYYRSIRLALKKGWNQETIGSHLVRNNHIHDCGQAGIVGSLGSAFSTITGNEIHEIRQHHQYGGCETAGIKLHGAIDTVIAGNHIYRCEHWGGIWLDWMSQGARVSSNLLHDNSNDLMFEMNHGPMLIDNNILLSSSGIRDASGGGAYVHNLIVGNPTIWTNLARRATPFFKPHSTEVIQGVVADEERFGADGGAVTRFKAPVENTEQDAVYQTVRYNTAGYRLEVANGIYDVTLKLVEPFYDASGKRRFGVTVQGAVVADGLDVFEQAGKNRAYDLVAEKVKVQNGVLQIGLIREKGHPCIAGIEVAGSGQTLRVNCGGPAWENYMADFEMAAAAVPVPLLEQPLTDQFGVTVDQDDDRYFNNLFVKAKALAVYDEHGFKIEADSNVYLAGAMPSKQDRTAVVKKGFDPGLTLTVTEDGWWLEMATEPSWQQPARPLVTSELLGRATISNAPFEDRNGTPYRINTDYFGKKRDAGNLAPGPFRSEAENKIRLKVWPRE